jgi:hypothetical protein
LNNFHAGLCGAETPSVGQAPIPVARALLHFDSV